MAQAMTLVMVLPQCQHLGLSEQRHDLSTTHRRECCWPWDAQIWLRSAWYRFCDRWGG